MVLKIRRFTRLGASTGQTQPPCLVCLAPDPEITLVKNINSISQYAALAAYTEQTGWQQEMLAEERRSDQGMRHSGLHYEELQHRLPRQPK